MNKDELLSLLDDADVRKKILAVVNQQTDDVQEPIPDNGINLTKKDKNFMIVWKGLL